MKKVIALLLFAAAIGMFAFMAVTITKTAVKVKGAGYNGTYDVKTASYSGTLNTGEFKNGFVFADIKKQAENKRTATIVITGIAGAALIIAGIAVFAKSSKKVS